MSIAKDIRDMMESGGIVAATFYGGYATTYQGEHINLPQGSEELCKRNTNGRVTHCRYRYSDNSVLTMKWSEHQGYSYNHKD